MLCSCVHPNIRILQPMFSLFFPWFHWSELEMRRQQSTKPSNVWFFFQKISRSNLWLTDPWQLQISLFLSLLALHLGEKLSDSHLHQAAQVFIMCMHTEYPIWCTPQRLQPLTRTPQTECTAAIYTAAFPIFIAQNPPHLLGFFVSREGRKCGSCAGTHRAKCLHFSPRVGVSKQRNLQWKITRNQLPFKWPNGWQTYLRHCAATNAETMWLRHEKLPGKWLNVRGCSPSITGCRQGLLVPPSVEMRLRTLSLDRMASLYAKCFA